MASLNVEWSRPLAISHYNCMVILHLKLYLAPHHLSTSLCIMELAKEPVGKNLYIVSTEVNGIEDCCLAKEYQHGAGYNGKHRLTLSNV